MTESEEFRITYPTVFNYTVPIKENADSRDDEMGAGVLIDIGGKLLIASAAHCIKNKPVVLETDFNIPAESKIGILRRGVHPKLDIGFMELQRNKAIPILNRGESSLGMICLDPLASNGMVHIVGFPAVARKLKGNKLTVVKKGFGTRFLRTEGDHFLFSYPKEGFTWDNTKNDFVPAPFDTTPCGYSGGGCWGFVQPKPGELFTPERHIRLYGIQIEWFEKERYVKCVPMTFWLAVVGSCCPDLRPAIASRFPSLLE